MIYMIFAPFPEGREQSLSPEAGRTLLSRHPAGTEIPVDPVNPVSGFYYSQKYFKYF